MDIERLQATAVEAVESNQELDQERRRKAETLAEANARLGESMYMRSQAFKDLVEVVHNYPSGRAGESLALAVGKVTMSDPSGEQLTRTLRARALKVHDTRFGIDIDQVLGPLAVPDWICMAFYVQAEEGDLETGLLGEVIDIGLEHAGDEAPLLGLRLTLENFHRNRIQQPSFLNDTVDGSEEGSYVKLAGSCDSIEATDRSTRMLETELSDMTNTLRLLQAGIEYTQLSV